MKLKNLRNPLATFLKRAFSLVELMVTLVVISCIMTALVPAITKKLKSQGITVGGSIGGGGGSSSSGSSNYDPNLTMDCEENFGASCDLCYTNACISCNLVCDEGQYKNVSSCSCVDCKGLYGEFCADCDTNKCTRCIDGHGLTSGGGCTDLTCPDGQYTDNGTTLCKTCEAGYYCVNGAKTACEFDEYSISGAINCIKCNKAVSGCERCSSATNCTKCEAGYTLANNSCSYQMEEKEFTAVETHTFNIPDDVKKIKALVVSGGAGGGGGAITAMTTDFITAGTHTWEIPVVVRGGAVKFSSVGASGGKAWCWTCGSGLGTPGEGGSLKNIVFSMPNQTEIKVIVGEIGSNATSASGCNLVQRWSSTQSKYIPATRGGYSGGSTYFEGYASNEYVAKGGDGAMHNHNGNYISNGCTSSGSDSGDNIFTTANVGFSRGHVGESGAMRIYWDNKTPATGGGTGHIAYNEEISVIPGEKITVIVGRGGKGGEINNQGEWGNTEMISKIIGSSGTVYITSAVSPSTMGSTGGNSDGATLGTAGYITDGQTSSEIVVSGLSGSDGGAISDLSG